MSVNVIKYEQATEYRAPFENLSFQVSWQFTIWSEQVRLIS